MSKIQKIIFVVLSGGADKNILFDDLVTLLLYLNFKKRNKGSHHIFYRKGIEEIINIQPDGKLAKPYQVKQIRNIITKYKLTHNEK